MDILTTTEDPRYRDLAKRYIAFVCRCGLRKEDRFERQLVFLRRDLGGDERVRRLGREAAEDLIMQIRPEGFRETVQFAFEEHDPYREAVVLLSLMGGGLGLLVVRFADLAEDAEELPDVPTGVYLN